MQPTFIDPARLLSAVEALGLLTTAPGIDRVGARNKFTELDHKAPQPAPPGESRTLFELLLER